MQSDQKLPSIAATEPDSFADRGRGGVGRAPAELPVLRVLGEHYDAAKPLTGARIAVLCPATGEVAALLSTLERLGAQIRWAASGAVDEAIMASACAAGLPVLARVEQGTTVFWDNCHRVLDWRDGGMPNLIIDTDSALARLVHLGVSTEAGAVPDPGNDDDAAVCQAIRRRLAVRPGSYSTIATNIIGLSECTARGVDRLRHIEKAEGLMFPAIDASSGTLPGRAPDRSRIAADALAARLASQALAQIELFSNGAAYRPGVHRFPVKLKRILSDLNAASGTAGFIAHNSLEEDPGESGDASRRPHRC